MGSEKIGVLLMAYGCPDSLEDVEEYYAHIRGGKKPRQEQVEDLKERYRLIGGRSPLLEITQSQARALEEKLNGRRLIQQTNQIDSAKSADGRFRVYVGMKHWHPYIEEAVKEMVEDGISRGIGLVLAPHYSRMSVEVYIQAVQKTLSSAEFTLKQVQGRNSKFHFIESWNKHPLFIEAVAEKIREAFSNFPEEVRSHVVVIFTAHSLPERVLEWRDPYPQELRETCTLLAEKLLLKEWHIAYQSAGHTKEKWLGPDILEELERLHGGGDRNFLIVPIGFVADHLEILYDIDVECKKFAESRGLFLRRTESLNTSPLLMDALAEIIQKEVSLCNATGRDQEVSGDLQTLFKRR